MLKDSGVVSGYAAPPPEAENKAEKRDRDDSAVRRLIEANPTLFRADGRPKNVGRSRRARPDGTQVRYHDIRKPAYIRFWWSDSGVEIGSIEYLRDFMEALVVSDRRMKQGLLSCFDRLVTSVKHRAARQKLPLAVDRELLWQMYLEQGGKCAVSRLPFSLERRQKALMPSVDQIVAGHGYTPENVRLVCYAVNVGLNTFGDDLYLRICRAVVSADNGRRRAQRKVRK